MKEGESPSKHDRGTNKYQTVVPKYKKKSYQQGM
jgi:hypothetical protein